MALDPEHSYYVYDFWNDLPIGVLKGTESLKQTLREGEARMMSVHRVEENPQFISTNRHIMQGLLDLKDCHWDEEKRCLSGCSSVVANESYKVVIASNGHKQKRCKASSGKVSLEAHSVGLLELTLVSKQNGEVRWSVFFD